jgi:hypothetical protein
MDPQKNKIVIVMPTIAMPTIAMPTIAMPTIATQNTNSSTQSFTQGSMQGTTRLKKGNNYKNMMSELMKPLPKEDKPNIHLGGGVFQKLEKI